MLVYIDGEVVDENDLSLSKVQRALWQGDGVFTTMRVENGACIDFNQHINRLKEQADIIEIKAPHITESDLQALINANQANLGLYRLKLMLIPLGSSSTPQWEGVRKAIYLARLDAFSEIVSPIRIKVYPKPFEHPMHPIKTHGYAHRQWLKKWAKGLGYDDALCFNHEGYILELSNSNLFWVKDQTLFTPDFNVLSIFKGLALKKHMSMYAKSKLMTLKIDELPIDAQFYSCNSLHMQVPIQLIDR